MATRNRRGRSSRLRYGEGTIDTMPDGTLRGRVMVNGRRVAVYGDTRAEVKDAMRDERERDGTDGPVDVPTFGEWLETWYANFAGDADTSPNTFDSYRWAIDKLEPLAGFDMDELRVADFEGLFIDLAAGRRGLSRSSVVRVKNVAGMAIDTFNNREDLTFNAAQRAKVPRTARATAKRRTLTADQGRALLEAARGDQFEPAVVLMLCLGMRPGEACGLTWDCVDLKKGTLDVVRFRERTFDDNGRQVMTLSDHAKAKSDRPLSLPAVVIDALRRHKKAQPVVPMHDGLVVTTKGGGFVDPANLRRAIRRLAKSAGIFWTPELRPYELRHTFASVMVHDHGLTVEAVADAMGNDPKTLTKHYLHRTRRRRDETVKAVDGAFGSAASS